MSKKLPQPAQSDSWPTEGHCDPLDGTVDAMAEWARANEPLTLSRGTLRGLALVVLASREPDVAAGVAVLTSGTHAWVPTISEPEAYAAVRAILEAANRA